MSKVRSNRLTGIRRGTLITTIALMASLMTLGVASSALAAPKGIFKVFEQCPANTPGVVLCQYSQTTSGEFVIGTTKVPITKTITLQGGGIPTGINLNEYFLIPAKNGESISKTELNVPGGLTGLVNCTEIKGEGFFEKILRETCKGIFENKLTGVTATTESVGNAKNPPILNLSNLIFEEGTALVLPVRVHLNNPLLGSGCYIGSEASPIELRLTTGTTNPPPPNKPIKGTAGTGTVETQKVGEKGKEREGEVNVQTGASLVDNSFSAPTAEGCGAFGLLNGIINAKIGLESKPGHNTAILTGTLRSALATEVLESEK